MGSSVLPRQYIFGDIAEIEKFKSSKMERKCFLSQSIASRTWTTIALPLLRMVITGSHEWRQPAVCLRLLMSYRSGSSAGE